MGPFYVDSDKADNTGDGLSWANAKKDLQNAVDLIDDLFTGTVNIYLNADASNDYNGNVQIENIRGVGKDAKLVISAANSGGTKVWNDTNYSGHTYSPFESGSTGTWDIKADDKLVTLGGHVQITSCGRVELNGFGFEDAILMGMYACDVTARYCRFVGAETFVVALGGGACLKMENCYFLGNTYGIACTLGATVMLMGDTYFEDPVKSAMIAGMGGKILVMPWIGVAPMDYNTTEIKTTSVRKNFTAIRAAEGSLIKVWDGYYPDDVVVGRLRFINDYKTISSSYVCVALESASMLCGVDRTEFVTKNSKNEEVEMPDGNRISQKDDENTLVVP